MDTLPRLTAEQTADRLGVKLETLYAYVARGRLGRVRTADGSSFDPLEVERFAGTVAAVRRAARALGRATTHGGRDPVRPDRGRRAVLPRPSRRGAGGEPFETVAHWALTGEWDATARFPPAPGSTLHAPRGRTPGCGGHAGPAAGRGDRAGGGRPAARLAGPAVVASPRSAWWPGWWRCCPASAGRGRCAERRRPLSGRLTAVRRDGIPRETAMTGAADDLATPRSLS